MFRLARLLAFALLLGLCGASRVIAADWQVVKVVGLVWVVGIDAEPQRATAGMILPDNATVATTSRARAMLRHGEDILNLGPYTHIAPQARAVHGLTTVLMRRGDLDLSIEHFDRPHFSVETPFLAAVVKGTRFHVSVHGKDAAVAVRTGRVQVTAFASRQAVDVTDGQEAEVTEAGISTSGQGTLPVVRSVAAETPLVEPEDVAETTGGTGTETNASVESAAALATDASVGIGTESTAAVDAAVDEADGVVTDVVDTVTDVTRGKSGNSGSGNSNAGGNGNSENSNAGGNSSNSNSGSGSNNAGGNGKGKSSE